MIYEIYKITTPPSESAPNGWYYIGQHMCHSGESEIGKYYFGSGKILLGRIYPKYGFPSYDNPLTDLYKYEHLCFGYSKEEIDELEISYIRNARNSKDSQYCINICDGGDTPPNHTDFVWINNGTIESRIFYTDTLPDGYVYGRLPLSIDPEWKWYTDGVNESKCEVCPDGWYEGRAPRGEFYHNPATKEIRMFYPNDDIPDGFIAGMGKQIKGPMSKCCWWTNKYLADSNIANPTDDQIWENSPEMVYNYFGDTDEEAKPKFLKYYKEYMNNRTGKFND